MAKKIETEQTQIEAPYALPDGWKWSKAENIADIYTGNSINEKVKQEKYMGQATGLNFIGTKDVDFDGSIHYENGVKIPDFENFKTAPANTPLLCIEGGSSGKKLGFTSEKVCFGNKLCAFVCKNVEPKLVYYYLQSNAFFHSFIKERHGLIGGVSVNTIKQIPFPLPSTLAEQRRIACRIENLFAKLDEAQEKAQSVLDGFETRKAAVLHKAFTGEFTAKWRAENGVADDNWEEKEYKDLGTSNLGKMLDENKNIGRDVRYLRNVNIRWFDFDLTDVKTMRASEEEIKKLCIQDGDMFICEDGQPGRCAIWKNGKSDLIFQKALHRFRPNKSVLADFLCYNLYYMSINGKLAEYFTGTTIKHLTGQSLAKIKINLPPSPNSVKSSAYWTRFCKKSPAPRPPPKRCWNR